MVWVWFACTAIEAPPPATPRPAVSLPVAGTVAEWRTRPLTLTRHGRCRMDCRHFDRAEVEAMLAEGTWNRARTRNDGRCPTHALEGTTRDGQHARMVFAACADEARLVTAIDLDTEWPCRCE